jgi:hypothetical protein
VIATCVDLITGEDAEPDLLLALGGPVAALLLDDPERADRYWPRVWGMRGLLPAWDPETPGTGDVRALGAVRCGLYGESWRGREMAAKVTARHRIGDALTAVAACADDPVPRVRVAAGRGRLDHRRRHLSTRRPDRPAPA